MKGPCRFEGCLRSGVRFGLCRRHREQEMRGEPLSFILGRLNPSTLCSVDSCTRKTRSRNLCWSHLREIHYLPTPRSISYAPRRLNVVPRNQRLEIRPDLPTWELVQARMKQGHLAKGEVLAEALALWCFVQRNGRLPGKDLRRDAEDEAFHAHVQPLFE